MELHKTMCLIVPLVLLYDRGEEQKVYAYSLLVTVLFC